MKGVNPTRIRSWLSANRFTEYVASNPACFLSVDFPVGTSGSCNANCSYCYAAQGRQAMPRAVELQWIRYQLYRCNPEGYAAKLRFILERFDEAFDLRIGSSRYPLRLFGAGDCGELKTFWRFHWALEHERISYYGYSRFLGVPTQLWYSADSHTSARRIAKAKQQGRRIAYVREPGDDIPTGVDLVFPEHSTRRKVPLNVLDCPKIRQPHEPGVCYDCKRCFSADVVQAAA